MEFIKDWGMIAGLAGLALGVFLILFREVIRKNIFAKLTKKQSYTIIIFFMILVWTLSLFSIFQYYRAKQNSVQPSVQLTFYVHGPRGKQDIILENTGNLIVDLGNDRRTPEIGKNGRTNLGEIPKKFAGKEIEIGLNAPGYELLYPNRLYKLNDNQPIYIGVKRSTTLVKISGIVKDRNGSALLQDALVTVDNDTMIRTDGSGIFKIEMPLKDSHNAYLLSVHKEGYHPETVYYYPNSEALEIRLNSNTP